MVRKVEPFSAETVLDAKGVLSGTGRAAAAGEKTVDFSGEHAHGAGIDGVAGALLVRFEADEARIDQHFQVLRHRGLRELHLRHDIAAAACRTFRKVLQDGKPGGVR